MKRYFTNCEGNWWGGDVIEGTDGDYVRYEEAQDEIIKLKDEVNELKGMLRRIYEIVCQ